MNKHPISLLLLSVALVGCSGNQGNSTSIDPNNVVSVEELANFLSASKMDVTSKLKIGAVDLPLFNFYADSEKYIYSYDSYDGVKYINTANKSFIEGDGFFVYKNADNSSDFERDEFNAANYVKKTKINKDGTLECKFDVKGFSTHSMLFDSKDLNEALGLYGVEMDEVSLKIYFEESKVKSLSINPSSAALNLTLIYDVNGYGDSVQTQTIDDSKYTEVDDLYFQVIENDIDNYLECGEGYYVEPVRHSMGFHTEYYVIGQEDFVVAKLRLSNNENFESSIYFNDTVYDGLTNTCTYTLCGKEFRIGCDFVPVHSKEKQDTSAFSLSYAASNPESYEHDFENHRVLLDINDRVFVVDTINLKLLKTIQVRGDIVNIIVHKDVYHIVTLTKGAPSAYEAACAGVIFVVDKKTLNVLEYFDVNTYPYSTAIDNRGDIIVIPGTNGNVPIYVYHKENSNLERISIKDVRGSSYLSYDNENDLFILNDQLSSDNVKPEIYFYRDGCYALDSRIPDDLNTSYGSIEFSYKNYIIAGTKIIDVSDWKYPKVEEIIDSKYAWDYSFSFADGNNIYNVTKDPSKGTVVLVKMEINETGLRKTVYAFREVADEFSFGFVRNNLIYLFNNTNQSFYTYNLD